MSTSAPKLLVMAGGTGGHIYPGVAVAEALRARGWQIAWMGNADRMEGRIVPQYGYELAWIRFGALRGKGLLQKLLLPLNLLRGFWQALRAIRRVKPDVVLGMGGFVSFPGGMMAVLLGKPLLIHEQNSIAGLANKVLAAVADRVATGFPDVIKGGLWLGNPVRAEIADVEEPAARFAGRSGPLRVLVVGGSLGAQALNGAVPQALALLPALNRPVVTHQSGANQLEDLRKAYVDAGVEGELLPFIDDMAARYAAADVVICRSGALTVAELAAVGVASVLVPFPHAVDDHQTGNARFLSERGAAELIAQPELSPQRLADWLGRATRERLLAMSQAARSAARAQAAEDVANLCDGLRRGQK
ncbi:undecaprenyldiphospho-muramoylpentapeptide beta-N-acetylglucosaminyltransferase [Uliginosibacterium flavum]|uniref:UDP-N-acetylglucosamine--N-acetylmuramyl-(pentapeptide) pyrophosphoryl-undecaprenol N-acetylglucosamine transferase n=1 Tax=Uliginosibacterium flavum TaxID=1396831 RepID=A0ABV2TMM0_9RHOO